MFPSLAGLGWKTRVMEGAEKAARTALTLNPGWAETLPSVSVVWVKGATPDSPPLLRVNLGEQLLSATKSPVGSPAAL